jgi:hypothetical protein
LREDSASPSSARTQGQGTISSGSFRSATSRRTSCNCCQSFSPKNAASGWVMLNSSVTTVATPSKWPGRCAPSSGSVTPVTEIVVA